MVRWIAFDEETADAIISRFKRGASELHDGNPLDAALNYGKPSLLLMPSSIPGKVLLAHIEPRAEPHSAPKIERKFWWKHEPSTVRTPRRRLSESSAGSMSRARWMIPPSPFLMKPLDFSVSSMSPSSTARLSPPALRRRRSGGRERARR